MPWRPRVWRLRADFARHRLLLRRFRQLRRVHVALWLLSVGVILYWLGWGQLVRFNWHLERTFLIDEVLILAPVLLPLVLSWAAFYEVDRAVRAGLGGQPTRQGQPSTRGRYLAFHVRHYLGLVLVPVLGLLAVQDAVELLAPKLRETGYEAVVIFPALAGLFLLFPVLLRYVWETRPLPPGPLRSRLEDAARRSGFRPREMLVWYTDGMVVNAAVAGFVRPLRYVFLTDALLVRLTDEEIETVFGHELGHVRHHHLLLRVMTMVAPLSLWLLFLQAFPQAVGRLQGWLDAGGLGVQAQLGVVMLAAMAVYVLVVFGYYSRLLEHQADLFAYRSAAADPQRPPVRTFTSALEKLAESIARRVDFLNQVGRDPKRELRFRRWVRLSAGLVIGIVISPAVYRLLLG